MAQWEKIDEVELVMIHLKGVHQLMKMSIQGKKGKQDRIFLRAVAE